MYLINLQGARRIFNDIRKCPYIGNSSYMVFEFLILEVIENLLKYKKKDSSKWVFYYYTLRNFKNLYITNWNPCIQDFTNSIIEMCDKDVSLEKIEINTWDKVFSINLNSIVIVLQSMLPQMKKHKFGSIVHISSIDALSGDNKPQDAYGSSKAALLRLSKSISNFFAAFINSIT